MGALRSSWDDSLGTFGTYLDEPVWWSTPLERYLFGGVRVRARAYNVFLQGQFRDSAVTYGGTQGFLCRQPGQAQDLHTHAHGHPPTWHACPPVVSPRHPSYIGLLMRI